MNTYEFLLEKYGPVLTLEQTSQVLHRPKNGVKLSSSREDNPLHSARRKIGRGVYFAAKDLAVLMDGTKEES